MRWFVGLNDFRYLDEGPRGTGTHVHIEASPVAEDVGIIPAILDAQAVRWVGEASQATADLG